MLSCKSPFLPASEKILTLAKDLISKQQQNISRPEVGVKKNIFRKKIGEVLNRIKASSDLLPTLFIFLLFNSCSPKIAPVEAPIESAEDFSITGTEILPDKWWFAFDDPELNELVSTALDQNLVMEQNWQEFLAALALVKREKSFFFPEIDARAGALLERPESQFGPGENLQLGLSASYEVDLWGRIRAGVDAEEFRAEAVFWDYRSAGMTISAETAVTWYELLTARKQLALVNEQIETNENIVKLIRARFTGGQIRAVDILRQEQLLESTRIQKIAYETEIELLENRLAVLLGTPPQNDLELPQDSLPALPPLPETGLPLELIRRRPDVQQAYNLVLAADRETAVAVRNKYPRLSVDVAGDVLVENSSSLFQNWAYSLAGNLVAPLLYGGRLNAEVERAEALEIQRLYQYGQTVLVAFREVEDALIREQQQKRRLEVLERQLELAQKTNRQLRIEFLNGLSDYLDVLLSLDQEQQLQRDLLQEKQTLLEIRIGLYRALAGGFETERENSLSEQYEQ